MYIFPSRVERAAIFHLSEIFHHGDTENCFLCALCASVVKEIPPFVKGDLGGFKGLKKNQQNDKETKVSYEKSIDNRYNRSGWS